MGKRIALWDNQIIFNFFGCAWPFDLAIFLFKPNVLYCDYGNLYFSYAGICVYKRPFSKKPLTVKHRLLSVYFHL